MSPKKRPKSKSGKLHSCDHATPGDEHSYAAPAATPRKPDLDERERLSTPERKAAGPSKRKKRSRAIAVAPPETPDVLPKALNKVSKKGKKP